jgi:hypothetical protein
MKKNVLSAIALFVGIIAMNAQITVTNSVFATAGVDLNRNIVNSNRLNRIDLTAPGPNQTWDMTDLQGNSENYTVQAASSGAAFANFPSTDIILPEIGGIAGDGYRKVDANQMSTVGVVATLDGFVTDAIVTLSSPRIDLQTPMNYGDTYTDSYGFQIALDPHEPAGTDLDSLITALEVEAGGLVAIDSIRVTFTTNSISEIDAWGSLATPSGTYDVLRLKKIDETNVLLEVKITVFGIPNVLWQDPADPAGLNIDPSGLPFVGQDTIYTYEFWNDNEKQPVLKANTAADGSNATYGQYKTFNTNTNSVLQNYDVSAYPNPAVNDFTLEMNGFDNGEYTLKMYNIIGKNIKNVPFKMEGDTKLTVTTNELDAGTYIYRLVNDDNKNLLTRRVIVIKP